MANQLNVGVVGVGVLGSAHARVYHELTQCRLAAIFDIDDERNRLTASQYNLPICRDLNELMGKCDAVSVVTPTDTHCQLALKLIGRGKHVFIEKPVSSNVAEAETIAERAKERGVTVAVGHIEHFNPAFTAVAGELGHPRFIEAHRLNRFSPRGLETAIILELMIHDIGLILSIVDSPIVEIRAVAVPVVSETDDIANCRLQFADGCVANLTASRISAHPLRKLRVFTRDRYASLDLKDKTAELYRLFRKRGGQTEMPAKYTPVVDAGNKRIARLGVIVKSGEMLAMELENFLSAITKKVPPLVGLPEATKALAVALDIARVAREHRKESPTVPPPVSAAD